MGRAKPFKEEFIDICYNLALLGATDEQMANAINVGTTRFYEYKKQHPKFAESIKKGGIVADSQVAQALFKRAVGFYQEVEELKATQEGIVKIKVNKYFPPEPTAIIYWLKCRQPNNWRDNKDKTQINTDDHIVKVEVVHKNKEDDKLQGDKGI